MAMPSTGCSGLEGAGDVELLPVSNAAAAGVVLGGEERPQSLAGLGRREEMPRSLKEETLPSPQGELAQLTSAAAS